jgi:hypothetical protein
MEALQKEAAKCKEGDTACQMAVAMKMMETDDAQQLMAEAAAAENAPPRYQPWKTPEKGGRIQAAANYQELWDGVFLTASREVRNCKRAGTASTSTPTLTKADREALVDSLKGLNLEIDTQTGKSSLMLVVGSYVNGELYCRINDGGAVTEERNAEALMVGPPPDALESAGYWIAGSTPAGTSIAHGEFAFDLKSEAHALTGMMSVTAPLKVKVRWDMTPL